MDHQAGELQVFLDISRKMNSTIEIEKILPTIVEIAKEHIGVERVSVFLAEGRNLVLRSWSGFNPENIVVIPIGEGVAGRVAASAKLSMVNNSKGEKPEPGYTANSYLSLPIVSSTEDVLGVLNLTNKYDDYFGHRDVNVADYLAAQCAIAVERYELYEKMRNNERLHTIGMMRASIAHDIRNLLGIVDMYVTLIEDNLDPDSVMGYCGAIKAEISRIQGLTQDIIDYSRQKIRLNFTQFDLNQLCHDVAKSLNMSLHFSKTRIYSISEEEVIVKGDKERLFRVIFNLANNAVQAVGDGGKVCIKCRSLAGKVSVSVSDNGTGIPEEIIKTLFNPFVTSGKAKGTGLGLAIVKEIVTLHNGSIGVRSKAGVYTIFRFTIPSGVNDG